MNSHVRSIAQRLSLRKPQSDSLDLVARVAAEVMAGDPNTPDLPALLAAIKAQSQSPEHFTDFERTFPNLCLALATGVGKTRLMGACIAYLHAAHGIRHFMVLAPNLTIYNKLIADFSEGTAAPKLNEASEVPSKYVFRGLAQYATAKPVIVTGDNYESGVGTQEDQLWDRIFINIFNISKFNNKEGRKFHKLSECIGESYFSYLASKRDLVLLMDEAHRYRASAAMDMINDLKPRLGIELTATPQIERGQKTEVFKNIAYQYNLSDAMRDGFVKEPEVATRENFKKDRYDDDALERLKLEDGIRIHNQKKVDLELYARDQSLPIVKPFMLIIAKDTTHAARLMTLLESKAFCDGDYKGKVLQVDSKSTSGNKEEAEDIVEKLLTVERFDNPIEIVIHVNMLKEGWDVTNLYTIVPLRAANSKTLVEQSIGRGLRLPYGRRTGVPEVDTLTIVGHDRFQDIVDEAQSADCVMKKRYLPENGEIERKEVVTAPNVIEAAITGSVSPAVTPLPGAPATVPPAPPAPLFATKPEQEAATVVYNTVKTIVGQLGSFKDLEQPEIQARLVREAGEIYRAGRQATIDGVAPVVDIAAVTSTMVREITKQIIEIPRVMVVPEGQVTGYHDFNLEAPTFRPQPIDDENLLLQNLNTNDRRVVEVDMRAIAEPRPEDYILNKLIDFEDVDYDQHSALINKLSSQMVAHIRSYLPDEKAIETVLRQNAREFARLIHAQMEAPGHYFEHAASYKAIVRPNMTILESTSHDGLQGQLPLHFRSKDFEKSKIRSLVFGGFTKCLYPLQKFSSDTERVFSIIIEDDSKVKRWVKPSSKLLEIDYRYNGRNHAYWPDFIIEAEDSYYLCEPKAKDEIDSDVIQEKAKAAVQWCKHATDHNQTKGLKPWRYLLIPHDEVIMSANLAGLAARCTKGS